MSPTRRVCVGALHIIQSLPSGHLRTGERLFDEVQPIAEATTPRIECHYWSEPTRDRLLGRLAQIVMYVQGSKRAPIVQIDAHGDEDGEGLILASGEFVPWTMLKGPLTAINVTCRLNLVVLVAACNARGLLEIVQPTDRAPVWGLIAPNRIVKAGEVERAYAVFYRTLLATGNGSAAWRAMNAAVTSPTPTFSFYDSEWAFRYVYAGYLRTHCTDQALVDRLTTILTGLIKQGEPQERVKASAPVLAGYLADHRAHFNEFKRRFFLTDLCPEHEERFPVTFEDCVGNGGLVTGPDLS